LKTIEVVMPAPMMPLIVEGVANNFTLHRLWETQDQAALLSDIGPRVRGLAAGGGVMIDGAMMDRLPKLEIIANMGVGYDRVDAAEAGRRGIIVTNTPDVLTEEVADLALGLLIATVRQLPQVDRYLRAGKWLQRDYPLTATLRGRIGKSIASRSG
jgi:lactate dehydrogenase-like 2-hydroxyacid dehydrogenase